MNLAIIYSKTGKGVRALSGKSKALSANASRILSLFDGKLTAAEVMQEFGKLNEAKFKDVLNELLQDAYIRTIAGPSEADHDAELGIYTPIEVAEISAEEFFQLTSDTDKHASEAELRERIAAEARAKAYAEEQQKQQAALEAQKLAEQKLLKATDILAKAEGRIDFEKIAGGHTTSVKPAATAHPIKSDHGKAAHASSAKARPPAHSSQTVDAEAAAGQEKADLIKQQNDIQLQEQAKLAAEARARQEAQQKSRLETERLAREAAAEARKEAQRQAAIEAERLAQEKAAEKARQQAIEQARLEAERQAQLAAAAEAQRLAQEAERMRAEAEARLAAEARARREAEEKARREAERLAREAAAEARKEAQRQAAIEAERLAQEKAAEKARMAAERQAQKEAAKQAKLQAAAEAKRRAETLAKSRAEEKAAEARARLAEKERWRALKAEQKQARAAAARAGAVQASTAYGDLMRVFMSSMNSWVATGRGLVLNLCIGTAAMLLVLVVALPFINLSLFTDRVAKTLSGQLGEAVSLSTLRVSLWPRPHMILHNVSMGNANEIQAATVQLFPELGSLFDDNRTYHTVKVQSASMDQRGLQKLPLWIKQGQSQYKFAKVELADTRVSFNELELPLFDAEMLIDEAGLITLASVRADGSKLLLDIRRQPQGHAINVSARNWQPLFGPTSLVFEEISGSGVLQGQQLRFSSAQGRLYGGEFKFNLVADFSENWEVDGNYELRGLRLEQAMAGLRHSLVPSGELDAKSVFSLSANDLQQLFEQPLLNATFSISNGSLHGIDLVKALQAGSSRKPAGGSTRFNELTGRLSLKAGVYRFRDLKLDARQLQASGEANVLANGQLQGLIDVSLKVNERQLANRIELVGSTASPSLR